MHIKNDKLKAKKKGEGLEVKNLILEQLNFKKLN
jgi:hypothetical protein